MKKCVLLTGLFVMLSIMFIGCAKPTQEIDGAKAAIAAAVKDGANIYSGPELEKLQADLIKAEDTVNAQSKKLFKSYGDSKELLAQLKTQAEEVQAALPAKKEAVRNSALEALNQVKTSIEEAKILLADAPKGKGSKADLEAFTADLQGLEDMLPELQGQFDGGDYFGTTNTAKILFEKVSEISRQITEAIQKIKK